MAPPSTRLLRGPGAPLDRAVRELYQVSWGKARGWIEAGKVSVDGATVTEATARVGPGASISVDVGARRPRAAELEDDEIIHADAQVVVVAKPAGVSTVPFDASETGTLDARVRSWLSRRGLAPRGSRASLGVVHRIDKETSGLVVFTRTWLAKRKLASQFRAHSVHRRYLAIAHGDVRSATLRSVLVADRGDGIRGSAPEARRRAVSRAPEGTTDAREALTHVQRVEALAGATLVACRLETGRTHQIRIQLAEGGHPLLGERVYVRDYRGKLLDAPRLMLHAAELGFEHPVTGQALRWEQPMPEDMRAVLERLRRR